MVQIENSKYGMNTSTAVVRKVCKPTSPSIALLQSECVGQQALTVIWPASKQTIVVFIRIFKVLIHCHSLIAFLMKCNIAAHIFTYSTIYLFNICIK